MALSCHYFSFFSSLIWKQMKTIDYGLLITQAAVDVHRPERRVRLLRRAWRGVDAAAFVAPLSSDFFFLFLLISFHLHYLSI